MTAGFDEGGFVLCTGTYERSLDGKNRLLLPKAVRRVILDSASLFITPGMAENCLELHAIESLEPLVQQVSSMKVGIRQRQSFLRMLLSQTEKCELDGQHRVRIPARLADEFFAGKNTTIVGVGTHWEIWDPEKWSVFQEQHQENFEAMAEEILGGRAMATDNLPDHEYETAELEKLKRRKR